MPIRTVHPSISDDTPCRDACAVWRRFRDQRPWPYQAYAIGHQADDGRIVAILSELPPGWSRAEQDQLVRAVFGDQLLAVERYRWANGIDGWLEDLVLTLRLSDAAGTTAVLGPDLKTWQAPSGVTEGLRAIDAALQGTSDGFWLEDAQRSAPIRPIQSVRVRPAEAAGWLSGGQTWAPLTDAAAPLAWPAMITQIGAYQSSDGDLIALVLPKKTAPAAARISFRRFALQSDLLVAAVRTPDNGFVLVGRRRQVPLSDLPPLRFETFAGLAASPSEQLAQSYERQRVFAGKIQSGPFKSWDWAPILLSKQLEDSEFGVLLNQADQVLKSWSQAGQVRYFDFPIAEPKTYPFQGPVSALAEAKLDASGTIFNWNTNGFSILVDQPFGRVLTADRSGALSVLYLPLQGDGEQLRDPTDLAKAWSREGRDYFEETGHPLVARVAQNTFLYQAVNNLLVTPGAAADPSRARTEVAAEALRAEAKAWLAQVAAATDSDDPLRRRIQGDVRNLIKTSGMTLDEIAELLATSQVTSGRLVRAENELHALEAKGRRLELASLKAGKTYEAAFETACKEAIASGGGRNATGCHAKSTKFSTLKGAAEARYSEYKQIKDALPPVTAAYAKAVLAYSRELPRYLKAQDLGEEIARSAWLSADLDGVKDRILAAAARDETTGSIRTSTLVLSQNTDEPLAVGGHNVGGRVSVVTPIRKGQPPPPGPKTTKNAPGPKFAPDAEVVPITADELPRITADSQASGELAPPMPPRQIAEALRTSTDAPRSLLDLVRIRRPVASEANQAALTRLRACNDCRAIVETTGPDTYTVAKRPPTAGRVEIIDGASGLIDVLADSRKGGEIVQFHGVDARLAEAISHSVTLKEAATPSRATLIEQARLLMVGRGKPPSNALILEGPIPGAAKQRGVIALSGRDAPGLARLARAKPDWSTAVVQAPEADAVAWLDAHPAAKAARGDRSTRPTVVVVAFPKATGEIREFAIVAEMPADLVAGAGARLRTLVQEQVSKAGVAKADIAALSLGAKARILGTLKAEDVTAFIKDNLGDVRIAEAVMTAAP